VATEHTDTGPFGSYAGYSVTELLATALDSLADCDRADAEFLQRLAIARPNELVLAELKWLVGICRHVAGKPLPRFNPSVYEGIEIMAHRSMRFKPGALSAVSVSNVSKAVSYPRCLRTTRIAPDRGPVPGARGGGRRDR
jgi:hypothetical protein